MRNRFQIFNLKTRLGMHWPLLHINSFDLHGGSKLHGSPEQRNRPPVQVQFWQFFISIVSGGNIPSSMKHGHSSSGIQCPSCSINPSSQKHPSTQLKKNFTNWSIRTRGSTQSSTRSWTRSSTRGSSRGQSRDASRPNAPTVPHLPRRITSEFNEI